MEPVRPHHAVLALFAVLSSPARSQPLLSCDASPSACPLMSADAEAPLPPAVSGVPSDLPGLPQGDFVAPKNAIEGIFGNDRPYFQSTDSRDLINGTASFAIPETGEVEVGSGGAVFLNDRAPYLIQFSGQPLSGPSRENLRASWSFKYRRLPPPEIVVEGAGIRIAGQIHYESAIEFGGFSVPPHPLFDFDGLAGVTIYDTGAPCVAVYVSPQTTSTHVGISTPTNVSINVSYATSDGRRKISVTGPGLVAAKSRSQLESACTRQPKKMTTIDFKGAAEQIVFPTFRPAIVVFGGHSRFSYSGPLPVAPGASPRPTRPPSGYANPARLIVDDLKISDRGGLAPPSPLGAEAQ